MTASSRIEAVAFDLDGLLVNTEELYQHVGTELLRRRGHSFEPDLLDAMMGRPQQVSLKIMIEWHGLTDTIEMLATETGEIFVSLLDTELRTMPGALELLDLLDARGIARGVATSSGPDFAHDVLGRMGIRDRFAFVLTSADVTHGKPHPEIYQTAAQRLAVDPGAMLVLEDSQAGCKAAVAAGAVAVAVPGGHSRRHDFTGAVFVAETLADPRIEALLAGWDAQCE
ncbi:MAG: HAD family phosphatase [Planctomycetia bacterium]|nr:HAD family phosphatase [Planctomycetia bacterium]